MNLYRTGLNCKNESISNDVYINLSYFDPQNNQLVYSQYQKLMLYNNGNISFLQNFTNRPPNTYLDISNNKAYNIEYDTYNTNKIIVYTIGKNRFENPQLLDINVSNLFIQNSTLYYTKFKFKDYKNSGFYKYDNNKSTLILNGITSGNMYDDGTIILYNTDSPSKYLIYNGTSIEYLPEDISIVEYTTRGSIFYIKNNILYLYNNNTTVTVAENVSQFYSPIIQQDYEIISPFIR